MIKNIFLGMVLLIIVSMFSCTKNDNSQIGSTNSNDILHKYVIELNLANCNDYFDIRISKTNLSIKESLTYALYDNCIVTYGYNELIVVDTMGERSIKLNKSRNWYDHYNGINNIVGISCTVTYWMQ